MRYHEEPAPWDDGEYFTGGTKPPKSHKTFVALLLIGVILLIGLSTLLGFSNLRLFQQLRQQKQETVCSAQPEAVSDSTLVQIDAVQETVGQTGFPALAAQETGLSLQEIYVKCSPSVVSITTASRTGSASGTGVIFSQDGYIVTNYHVVEGGESYTVLLSDERSQGARLVGSDAASDLAVLQIDAGDLTPAQFGDSDYLRVGDSVVAIGDPLGVEYRGTMTNGIVSAINRNVNMDGRVMDMIQTNAALNSGNSGGPLINSLGQVIGINTVKIGAFADKAGVEGLGFAIPSATVLDVINQIVSQGYVSGRPYLGITGESLGLFYQRYYRLPSGLYINSVEEDSAAAQAGITQGDILISLDGSRVTSQNELDTLLYRYNAGDRVTIVIYRGGYTMQTEITLEEAGSSRQTEN